MLDSPSTFPAFSSLSLSYLFAICPCLTCSVPKAAPPCPHARLRSDPLTHIFTPVPPGSSPSPNQGNFFFPFSYSCPPCKVVQLRFTPGLLCVNHFPFHTFPPAHQVTHATPHLKGSRHLQTVLVTLFLYLSGLTFHPGNKNATLPSKIFITINFHS